MRFAPLPIQAGIGQYHIGLVALGRKVRAMLRSKRAAHFEEVGKIGMKGDFKVETPRKGIVILDREMFEAARFPQETGTTNVNEIVLEDQLAASVVEIRIRQIAGHRCVIVPHGRAQQHWPLPSYREVEVREITCILMENSFGAARAGKHVAIMIEHRESVAVFERARSTLL